jgi:hypothetical protein
MFKDVLASDKRSFTTYSAYDDRLNALSTYNLNDMNSRPYQYQQQKASHIDLHQYNDQNDKRYIFFLQNIQRIFFLKYISFRVP